MKIGFTSIDLREGKIKYEDENLIALEAKDKPKKVAPFFAEFIRDEFVQADVIVIPQSEILDLLILDMEKIETQLMRLTDSDEKALMEKCMGALEKGIPLSEVDFNDAEKRMVRALAPHSLKPVVQLKGGEDVNTIIALALAKAGYMFFYTAGRDEARAWPVEKGSNIVTCAAKIHTDLARGFIKGDVVSFDDYMHCHNFNDCKSKGLAKLVDRDYTVHSREIIEIRFNV